MKFLLGLSVLGWGLASAAQAPTPARQRERLDRGLVAVRAASGEAFVSWRALGSDAPSLGFTLWRDGKKLTPKPLTGATCFVDSNAPRSARYSVQAGSGAKPTSKSADFRFS